MTHAAVKTYPLKILRWLFRFGNIGEHEAQLARQLLMRLRRGPRKCLPKCRVQQSIFWAVVRKFVELGKETILSAEVLPKMCSNLDLAAQRKYIVLPRGVITAQPSLDNVLHGAQKLADEDFEQGHVYGHQLGAIGLDVAESTQTAQHLNQKLPRLHIATANRLANLWQHLDLKPVRRTDHANETGYLHGTTSAPLL
ncbi:hypothetical protein B7760_03207 [Burkholderia glumae]|nr:hypothetical protein B7760_03207 [Burkholderia glumae]